MLKSLIFNYLLTIFSFSPIQDTGNYTLIVGIENVKKQSGGSIFIMLVDQNDKPLVRTKRALTEGNTTFSFNKLPAGSYAVRVFHDQNNNENLDKGIFGQPLEGWGVSNNVRGFMSAPDFKKMLLRVEKDLSTTIKLSY